MYNNYSNMTTITFEKNIALRRSKFKDIFDFYSYIKEKTDLPLLVELGAREMSGSVKSALKKAKQTSRSRLVNL